MENAPAQCFYGALLACSFFFLARIRLLWILEGLVQLRSCRHRHGFHPLLDISLPAEFWFEIHVHQHYFLEKNANWHRVIQQGS